MGTTPEQAMEIIHERFGAHERHRALHAKGVHLNGTFTATPEAAQLSKAAFLNGSPVTCNVRLSNGGGDPNVPDYVPDVRGLAVAFNVGEERRALFYNALGQACRVAQIDEQNPAMVAFAVNPPRKLHGLAYIAFCELAACMGSVKMHDIP